MFGPCTACTVLRREINILEGDLARIKAYMPLQLEYLTQELAIVKEQLNELVSERT